MKTKTMKNFRAIVNDAGLPIEIGLVDGNVSNSAIEGFSAEELAWLYWMTKAINIEYRYVINGRAVERKFELDASAQEPENRSLVAPIFHCNYFDDRFKTSTNIHIPLHLACKNAKNPTLFDVPITFTESAPNGIFSLEVMNSRSTPIDRISASFFEKQINFGICSKNQKLPAKIDYINLYFSFFT